MVKYCLKVFDRDTGDLVIQTITDSEHLKDVIDCINDFGIVKGFLMKDEDV